jgi:hypothetical protein
MAHLKRMMNLNNARIGPNRNCTMVFGTQAIDPNAAGNYNLLDDTGGTYLYGTPSSSQNLITGVWQVSSVTITPVGRSTYFNSGQYLLFASLTLTLTPTQGNDATAPESMPLIFVLNNGTNTVVGCSSASSNGESVVRLPTCVPGQHLFYASIAAGTQPVWTCQ